MKTHFATVERANESDNNDYWSPTLCGLEHTNSPLSDKIENVTCKTCQQFYPTYKKQIEEALKKEFSTQKRSHLGYGGGFTEEEITIHALRNEIENLKVDCESYKLTIDLEREENAKLTELLDHAKEASKREEQYRIDQNERYNELDTRAILWRHDLQLAIAQRTEFETKLNEIEEICQSQTLTEEDKLQHIYNILLTKS